MLSLGVEVIFFMLASKHSFDWLNHFGCGHKIHIFFLKVVRQCFCIRHWELKKNNEGKDKPKTMNACV